MAAARTAYMDTYELMTSVMNLIAGGIGFLLPKSQTCGKEREMLFSLAVIFLCGMGMGALFRRLNLPQLLGMLLTGILLGP